MKQGFSVVGLALLVAGLVMGFVPVTVGDESYGDGFKCGSAFVTSDELTDLGHETCLINGGAANRRINALALIAAGAVLLLGAAAFTSGKPEPTSASLPPPPTSGLTM